MHEWDRKAEFWDQLMGEQGNDFHRSLVIPATGRLLALRPGERVLDLACGTGVVSRWLHRWGARVTAVDGSAAMLARARNRGPDEIDYLQLDLTVEQELAGLGSYDAAVCAMGFMDIADLDPMLQAMPRLLAGGGRLVVTVCHPCFNFTGAAMFCEREDRSGTMVTTTGVRVANYLDPLASPGAGAPGEPCPHTYYHRPLHDLLGRCFAAGLVLDGIEEPTFCERLPRNELNWSDIPGIPPVLALRLR